MTTKCKRVTTAIKNQIIFMKFETFLFRCNKFFKRKIMDHQFCWFYGLQKHSKMNQIKCQVIQNVKTKCLYFFNKFDQILRIIKYQR